jgi:NTE family protein
MNDMNPDDRKKDRYIILALQGGGALGAFQAGAYQALSEYGYEPDWVAGISIGAINASIIAGNQTKEIRLERLKKFWNIVAGDLDWWERIPNYCEKITNVWRVCLSMAGGVSGFFRPNYIPGPFADPNSPEASSLYNTETLKTTLKNLVDFEFLKNYQSDSHVRLSLGTTRVFGGTQVTFHSFDPPKPDPDDRRTEITAEHIMASGALAPWFPGISLEEFEPSPRKRLYWDGGISSNSSFKHIIDHLPVQDKTVGDKHVLIFLIDLWGAFDREPKTFDEVCWRIKQIQYSSRIEQDIEYAREHISSSRLSGRAQTSRRIDIIRVSYRSHPNEIPCGDGLFSRTEIQRRFQDGYAAMLYRLEVKPSPWELDFDQLGPDNKEYREACVAVHLF